MRSVRLGIVVLAVLALTAAGCGDDDDEGGSQSTAATAASDASVSLAGTCSGPTRRSTPSTSG